MSKITDLYLEGEGDTAVKLDAADYVGIGQAFLGDGGVLASCKFYGIKTGTPAENVVAKVYAHTGTWGTSGKPNGSALATSANVAGTAFPEANGLVAFTFSGANKITLAKGTHYVLTCEYASGTGTDYISILTDHSSPYHDGNGCTLVSTTWTQSADDTCFYVYRTEDDLATSLSYYDAKSNDHLTSAQEIRLRDLKVRKAIGLLTSDEMEELKTIKEEERQVK